MTHLECFWEAEAPTPKSYTEKPLPEKTDVLVVGGGFTGTSAALQLAKGGARVTLLEAKRIGWGASARNGGQALSCLHHNLVDLIKQHGLERARAMFQASVHAADTVERIVTEEKIDCGFERVGHIEAASKPVHFKKLVEERETLARSMGFQTQIIPQGAMAAELGTNAYYGAIVNPFSGKVQPAKFVRGMAEAAERTGADLHERTRVLEIERKGDAVARNGFRFTVKTDRGIVAAKEVFVAANAWVGKIVPQFRHRVFPAESFIIATQPLREDVARRLIPHNRMVFDTKKLLVYYRLSDDQRMVFGGGGSATGLSARTNIGILRRTMAGVFPELKDVPVDYFWGGTLGMTLDQTAHAGQVDGVWFSMCYVGHGVTLATFMGEQVANAILGRESENPFAGLSIPRAPFYRGRAWFVNVGKTWFRFMDLFG